MHKAALSFFQLTGVYDLLDVPPEQLSAVFPKLKQSYRGLNVTIPHKQTIVRHLDELTPEARMIQAVNTIRIEPSGRAIGHNTDAGGFLNALKNTGGDNLKLPCVCLIGAGGAARAALWAISKLATTQQIVIYARTQREARMMRDDFFKSTASPVQVLLRSPGEALNTNAPALIINCTPIGLGGEAPPDWLISIMNNSMRGQHTPIFFDMVYSRSTELTPLVKKAAELGLVACDGLQMLIEQAALSFEFWTGKAVPADVMASGIAQSSASGATLFP
jgi:shikimate dehydrogenase